MYGWTGTFLRVDLTTGRATRERTNPRDAKLFLGARGLGARLLSREVSPAVDALSPDNKLIFAPGPLSGTFAPSMGRYDVIAKSPLTGAIAASNSGGTFGPELKFAGYDMLVIEGKAHVPVYLWIHNDEVEIREAGDIWGNMVPETTEMVRLATDEDARVACIGPAGEKLSMMANIMNDMHRAAGRSGVGAVMGAKNLKAVAVVGTKPVKVADPEAFEQAVLAAREKISKHPIGGKGLRLYGTDVLVNILNEIGSFPTRNFRDGYFAAADKIGGESLASEHLLRPKGCFACTISCGRVTKVTNPKFAGEGEGPEYETAWGFGADCGVDNLEAVCKANYLCNELGLDTISTASTIACAMDMYADEIISPEDTGGFEIRFGDAETMIELVRLTGLREGFGDRLADGSFRMAEKFGHAEYSMSVKKQEIPAYDPRGIQGIGLQYATSNRGGCHVRGYTISPEVLGVPVKMDQRSTDGKPEMVIELQNLGAALDATGACLFTTFGIGAEELAALLSSVTGVKYTSADLLKAGERIWNLERQWNLAVGLTSRDDTLPTRLLNDPIASGPSRGKVSRLREMLPAYYELRGWDAEGIPTPAKLKELSLA